MHDFLFLGGHRALDLVNTRTVDRGQAVERLGDFAALLAWTRASGALAEADAAVALARWAGHADGARIHAHAVALRESLRLWLTDGRSLEPLLIRVNRYLALARPATCVVPAARGVAWQTRLDDAGPEALLRALATAVGAFLCDVPRKEVHRCESADCEAWFHASGRTVDRRWCSTARCGGRRRTARYAKRAPRHRRGP